jgi:nucleotide-binding universal stress UspA family protein
LKELTVTSAETEPLHRIIVGIDGSPSSAATLEWAARQAELTGSTLEAITTWEWPINYGWAFPFPSGYDPADDADTMLTSILKTVKANHPNLPVQTTIVEGHPAPVLVAASRRADLLVVGSRGHGEFAGMLIGSVSEHCVTNAHCPVLVLREERS